MKIWYGLLMTVSLLWAVIASFPQQLIVPGTAHRLTLTPESPTGQVQVEVGQPAFIEVIATTETESPPLSIHVTHRTDESVDLRETPVTTAGFSGAYLFSPEMLSGTLLIEAGFASIDEPVELTLRVQTRQPDAEFQPLAPPDSLDATTGPEGDIDFFEMFLPQNFPVILSVYTSAPVLDPVLGLFDPQGQLMNVNNDFIQAQPALLLNPPVLGFYTAAVSGRFAGSVGPYRIIANPVEPLTAGSDTTARLRVEGDLQAFEVPVQETRTYDFRLQSEEEIETAFALVTEQLTIITAGVVNDTTASRIIPGFTPLQDESLYLIVFAEEREQTGSFDVSYDIRPDESDGEILQLNETRSSALGPIGDQDIYRFDASADQAYSIWVDPTWHLLDPALLIRDAAGNKIAYLDDAVEDVDALLSGFTFPEAGRYQFEVVSSPNQPLPQRLTGMYNITVATGTPFDTTPPRIFEPAFDVTRSSSESRIRFSSDAVLDDTFPIDVTFVGDQSGNSVTATLTRSGEVEARLASLENELLFVHAVDGANTANRSRTYALPAPERIATVTGQMLGLAISATNEWLVSESRTGDIFRIRPDGATETVYSGPEAGGGLLGPNALALDAFNRLHVSDARTNQVYRVIDGTTAEPVLAELQFPTDIAFDEEGSLYVSQIGSDVIERLTPEGVRSVVTRNIRNPSALAFSPQGTLHAVNSNRGQSTVYKIAEDGSVLPVVEPFAESLEGLAFDTDGFLYTIDGVSGTLYRISPDREIRILARGLSGPSDLAFGTGEFGQTLFVTNLGSVADLYAQQFIAVQTGRWGMALPFGTQTDVSEWGVHLSEE